MIINKSILVRRLRELPPDAQSPYFEKDMKKAARCNKFIGQGSLRSSSDRYRRFAGNLANCGQYTGDDWVFISAEGNRSCRRDPDWNEITKAIEAHATFVTDNHADRNRDYNVGERKVADFLTKAGYKSDEYTGSVWTPNWKSVDGNPSR